MFEDGSGISNSPFIKKAAAQILDDQEFERQMGIGEINLGQDAKEFLCNKNWRLGCATAYVVDLAVRELPPRARSLGHNVLTLGIGRKLPWPEGMHAMAARLDLENEDDPKEVQERLVAARELFAQTKKTKLRESRVPRIGTTIRYEEIHKINPGYRDLKRRLAPVRFRGRELRDAYKSGFDEGIAEVGLEGLQLAHGREILRRTPRRVRVIPVQETDAEVRVLTEYGNQLRWSKPKLATKDPVTEEQEIKEAHALTAYSPQVPMEISAQSVWERTRAKKAGTLADGETQSLYHEILAYLEEEVNKTSAF